MVLKCEIDLKHHNGGLVWLKLIEKRSISAITEGFIYSNGLGRVCVLEDTRRNTNQQTKEIEVGLTPMLNRV